MADTHNSKLEALVKQACADCGCGYGGQVEGYVEVVFGKNKFRLAMPFLHQLVANSKNPAEAVLATLKKVQTSQSIPTYDEVKSSLCLKLGPVIPELEKIDTIMKVLVPDHLAAYPTFMNGALIGYVNQGLLKRWNLLPWQLEAAAEEGLKQRLQGKNWEDLESNAPVRIFGH